MALNLWKLAGKPTAYSPLPTGYTDSGFIRTGSMKLKFKAKSSSKANLRVFVSVTYALNSSITLTEDLKEYEYDFFYNQVGVLSFHNINNVTDIIIQDIELVRKPLPKLTINGIDGFNSGKWVLNSSLHTVINDETLELNATSLSQNAYILVDVIPNTVYTYGLEEGLAAITTENASSFLLTPYASGFRSFNTGNNSKIRCYLSNASVGTGRFIFKRPMLNLGSTPAPYSKKTGDRMVEPTPVKNLFDKTTITSNSVVNSDNGSLVSNTLYSASDFIMVEASKMYYKNSRGGVAFYDSNKTFISGLSSANNFQTPSNTKYIRTTVIKAEDDIDKLVILDNVQINPKAKRLVSAETGLRFEGDSYLQLPSMTMDSIEIECLIDSVQKNQTYKNIIDARSGLTSGYVTMGADNNLYTGSVFTIEGFAKNERTKIKASRLTPFTDDVTIFAGSTGADKTMGTLYKVTCYLNGGIVAQYDFENPSTLVGDKVVESPKNLIPSFEDSRWNLHADFKVLGERVGQLETGSLSTTTIVHIPVTEGKTYQFLMEQTSGLWRVYKGIWDGASSGLRSGEMNATPFQVDSSFGGFITVRLTNINIGNYDFINPQLYELTGNEGTVIGKPSPLVKKSKRTLYAKR